MKGSTDTVLDCTSQVFEGMITLNGINDSWVARWQRLEGYQAGTYAVKVVGIVSIVHVYFLWERRPLFTRLQLPEDYIAAAENFGVKYIPRDGSDATDDQ